MFRYSTKKNNTKTIVQKIILSSLPLWIGAESFAGTQRNDTVVQKVGQFIVQQAGAENVLNGIRTLFLETATMLDHYTTSTEAQADPNSPRLARKDAAASQLPQELQDFFFALSSACRMSDYTTIKNLFESGILTDEGKRKLLIAKNASGQTLFTTWLSNPHTYKDFMMTGIFLLNEMKKLDVEFLTMKNNGQDVVWTAMDAMEHLSQSDQDQLLGLLICSGFKFDNIASCNFLSKRKPLQDEADFFQKQFENYVAQLQARELFNHNTDSFLSSLRGVWTGQNHVELARSVLTGNAREFGILINKMIVSNNPDIQANSLKKLMNEPLNAQNDTLLTLLAQAPNTFGNHMILVECLSRGLNLSQVFSNREQEANVQTLTNTEERQRCIEEVGKTLQTALFGFNSEPHPDPLQSPTKEIYGMNNQGQTAATIAAREGKGELLWHLLLAGTPTEIGALSESIDPDTYPSLIDSLQQGNEKTAALPAFFRKKIIGAPQQSFSQKATHALVSSSKKIWALATRSPQSPLPVTSEFLQASYENKRAALNRELSPLKSYLNFSIKLQNILEEYQENHVQKQTEQNQQEQPTDEEEYYDQTLEGIIHQAEDKAENQEQGIVSFLKENSIAAAGLAALAGASLFYLWKRK